MTSTPFLAQSRPMTTNDGNLLHALGFLRIALLGLTLLNLLLPLAGLLLPIPGDGERNLWVVLTTVVTPVMAPLLVVVLLFDYIMSRVHAADSEGSLRGRYLRNGHVALAAIGISLLFWVPYFMIRLA